MSIERLREVLGELDREKQVRLAAERSKLELQVSFTRLKVLAQEAIRKRDNFGWQRENAIWEKEERTKQLEVVVKERDALRSKIGNSSHMLVTGMEKISAKMNSFDGSGVLHQSDKYTDRAAKAYNAIKRANKIVEELLRQNDTSAKSKDQAREQMEQMNYEIAIEVSQLEVTISGLRDEVVEKASPVGGLEWDFAARDQKLNAVSERGTARARQSLGN